MTVLEEVLKKDMALVVYDFESSPQGNAERARLRNKLKSAPFYGMMMTQSVYMCSELVVKTRLVQEWADSSEADIRVFNDISTTLKERKRLAREFVDHLHDIKTEVDDIAFEVFKELEAFEDDMQNQKSFRGWHRKVESITNRFDDIRRLINRVGDKHDEFEFQKLDSFIKTLSKRYEKIREMWKNKDWLEPES